jgi:hypothetical protein
VDGYGRKEEGLGTIIIIIIRHLNFNALWLVAEEGRGFEATLGLDKRDGSPLLVLIHWWEKVCGVRVA